MSIQIVEERLAANMCICGCPIAKHAMSFTLGNGTVIDKKPCKVCGQEKCGNFGRGKKLTPEQIKECGFNMEEFN